MRCLREFSVFFISSEYASTKAWCVSCCPCMVFIQMQVSMTCLEQMGYSISGPEWNRLHTSRTRHTNTVNRARSYQKTSVDCGNLQISTRCKQHCLAINPREEVVKSINESVCGGEDSKLFIVCSDRVSRCFSSSSWHGEKVGPWLLCDPFSSNLGDAFQQMSVLGIHGACGQNRRSSWCEDLGGWSCGRDLPGWPRNTCRWSPVKLRITIMSGLTCPTQ